MPPKTAAKTPPKTAASAKGGDKGTSEKSITLAKPGSAVQDQAYCNDYTNKLRDQLKKQLQSTKGFPEKLKQKIAEVQKQSENKLVDQVIAKDMTLDMELLGLAKKHNYTDRDIHRSYASTVPVEQSIEQAIVRGEIVVAHSPLQYQPTKKELEELNELEFNLRDYIRVKRAKSAHPLGRAKSVKSMVAARDISMELSSSALNQSMLTNAELKYERQEKLKDIKDKMKTFTDRRLNRLQRRKNQEVLRRINEGNDLVKAEQERQSLKELLERREENRQNKLKRIMKEKRDKLIEDIKKIKEKNKDQYYKKFPNVPTEVRELREIEHREKYLKDPPLHQRLLKDFEEREKRKLQEVKDELHQVRNQPIDFVKLKQHEEKVMKMIQRQHDERKQIQTKVQEMNASTNVEKIQTVYQSSINEIKDRIKKREEYAEKFKAENLKETLGAEEGDEEADEEEKDQGVKDDVPAIDQRKKFMEKEEEEFRPYLELKKEDDWTEFQKKSRYWDQAKLKRFHTKRLKHQMKEYEETELAKVQEQFRNSSHKKRPDTVKWDGDSTPLPEPKGFDKKTGKPIYNPEEMEAWKKENEEKQRKFKEREEKRLAKEKQAKEAEDMRLRARFMTPEERDKFIAAELSRQKVERQKVNEGFKKMKAEMKLDEILNSPEKRMRKMNNFKKLNEIGKLEDRVKSMEQLNNVMGRSLKSASVSKLPPITIADIEKRQEFYIKKLLPETKKVTELEKKKYSPKELLKLYEDERVKQNQELQKKLTESIQKENEIDDIYMTAINTKLKMLESQG